MSYWVKVNKTFDGNFAREAHRRYGIAHVNDMFVEELLRDALGLNLRFDSSFKDGVALFQALIEIANRGEFSGAEVRAFGYSPDIACWSFVFSHESLGKVESSELLSSKKVPHFDLIFEEGDREKVGRLMRKLRRGYENLSSYTSPGGIDAPKK